MFFVKNQIESRKNAFVFYVICHDFQIASTTTSRTMLFLFNFSTNKNIYTYEYNDVPENVDYLFGNICLENEKLKQKYINTYDTNLKVIPTF